MQDPELQKNLKFIVGSCQPPLTPQSSYFWSRAKFISSLKFEIWTADLIVDASSPVEKLLYQFHFTSNELEFCDFFENWELIALTNLEWRRKD